MENQIMKISVAEDEIPMSQTLKLKLDKSSFRKGFTLLEIILAVAAISILAGIVIIAVNPGKQLGDNRNSQRWSDVNTILNAVYQYSLNNNGDLPAGITTAKTEICKTGGTCTGLADLSVLITNEKYLVTIPTDPQSASTNGTGYEILKTANGRVKVSAPNAEQGETITVTR